MAHLLILLPLFLAAAPVALAQYDEGYSCWQCPVCGAVFSLTPEEAENVDPYSLCPYCGMAYAGYFIQVPCQDAGFDDYYDYDFEEDSRPETKQDIGPVYIRESVETEDSENLSSTSPVPVETAGQRGSASGPSKPREILMVVPERDYQEDELNVARDVFQESGYRVVLASRGVRTATGMSGAEVSIDQDVQDINLSPYLAVVFVGGEGIYSLKLNEESAYQKPALEAADQGKLIAAICLGPWILADAGLLNGKRATASETDHLREKGALVADEDVVVDGRIITASGPSASQEFAEAVVAALESEASA